MYELCEGGRDAHLRAAALNDPAENVRLREAVVHPRRVRPREQLAHALALRGVCMIFLAHARDLLRLRRVCGEEPTRRRRERRRVRPRLLHRPPRGERRGPALQGLHRKKRRGRWLPCRFDVSYTVDLLTQAKTIGWRSLQFESSRENR